MRGGRAAECASCANFRWPAPIAMKYSLIDGAAGAARFVLETTT